MYGEQHWEGKHRRLGGEWSCWACPHGCIIRQPVYDLFHSQSFNLQPPLEISRRTVVADNCLMDEAKGECSGRFMVPSMHSSCLWAAATTHLIFTFWRWGKLMGAPAINCRFPWGGHGLVAILWHRPARLCLHSTYGDDAKHSKRS